MAPNIVCHSRRKSREVEIRPGIANFPFFLVRVWRVFSLGEQKSSRAPKSKASLSKHIYNKPQRKYLLCKKNYRKPNQFSKSFRWILSSKTKFLVILFNWSYFCLLKWHFLVVPGKIVYSLGKLHVTLFVAGPALSPAAWLVFPVYVWASEAI